MCNRLMMFFKLPRLCQHASKRSSVHALEHFPEICSSVSETGHCLCLWEGLVFMGRPCVYGKDFELRDFEVFSLYVILLSRSV